MSIKIERIDARSLTLTEFLSKYAHKPVRSIFFFNFLNHTKKKTRFTRPADRFNERDVVVEFERKETVQRLSDVQRFSDADVS